ncbi:MAG: hypothetical protein QGH76_05595 [Phycisphaerales bacterium]|nr:hypothetical protein [Phycisphaerales bacterium]
MSTPTTSLAPARIVTAQVLAVAVSCGVWVVVALLGGWNATAGLIETVVVGAISLAMVAVIRPSNPRPVATFATVWMVASLTRFAAALGATFLLHSAAQLDARPLLFSFLLVAVLLLLVETRAVARTLSANTLPSNTNDSA